MTITLDEIICVSREKLLPTVIDKIVASFCFKQRKPKREKIKFLLESINEKELWHKVQTELIFFRNDLNNVCFFNPDNGNEEKFLKNLEYIVNDECSKVKHIDINYKNYMKIFDDIDSYSLMWHKKKESILKALTPVAKASNIRKLNEKDFFK